MPLATWNQALSLGIKDLDADHQRLIDTLNDVFDSLLLGNSSMATHSALITLDAYVTEHFQREEMWLSAISDPDLEQHKKQHRALAGHVKRLLLLQNHSDEALTVELLIVLRDWLFGHIAQSDRAASS